MKSILQLLYVSIFTVSAAFASPGAHGPNGEHLDAPGPGHVHGNAGPRIEASTGFFELVGRVQGDELSILIDRYETNEPVLDGKLEVEARGIRASATFHADHGDYAVDDPQFLKAIAAPGKHRLAFTLAAGGESDRLEGTLEVTAADGAHGHAGDHSRPVTRWAIAGGLVAAVLAALAIRLLRRQSATGK